MRPHGDWGRRRTGPLCGQGLESIHLSSATSYPQTHVENEHAGFGGVSEQRTTTLSGDFRRSTPVVVAATADVRQCAAVLVYDALFYFIPTASNCSLFVFPRKRGTERVSRAYNSVCCSETGREYC